MLPHSLYGAGRSNASPHPRRSVSAQASGKNPRLGTGSGHDRGRRVLLAPSVGVVSLADVIVKRFDSLSSSQLETLSSSLAGNERSVPFLMAPDTVHRSVRPCRIPRRRQRAGGEGSP